MALAAVAVVTMVVGLVIVDTIVGDTAVTSTNYAAPTLTAATWTALSCGNGDVTNMTNPNSNATYAEGAYWLQSQSENPARVYAYANFTNARTAGNLTNPVTYTCNGIASSTTRTVMKNAPVLMGVAGLALAGGWLWLRG